MEPHFRRLLGVVLDSELRWDLKRPCGDCPFLRTSPFHAGVCRDVVTNATAIQDGSFVHTCHKTDARRGVDGPLAGGPQDVPVQVCAGSLMMLLKHGAPWWQRPIVKAIDEKRLTVEHLAELERAANADGNDVFTLEDFISFYRGYVGNMLAASVFEECKLVRKVSLAGDRVAVYSPGDPALYRYALTISNKGAIEKPEEIGGPRFVAFVGLNPSTATEAKDDPTVKRCRRFADSWGFDGIVMLNAYAWRDTDPRKMKAAAEPVGVANDHFLRAAGATCGMVVLCWGNHADAGRVEELRVLFEGVEVKALRVTKSGAPEHPLYMPSAIVPAVYGFPRI
jgi:hypothetical protein